MKEIKQKIEAILKADGKSVTFDFKAVWPSGGKIGELADHGEFPRQLAQVTAFTINNKTKEKFLLKIVVADNNIEAIQKILEYVEKSITSTSSFTVRWCKKENGQLGDSNLSYFYCHDALEVVKKFFEGKSVNDYVIYEIKLNPIA